MKVYIVIAYCPWSETAEVRGVFNKKILADNYAARLADEKYKLEEMAPAAFITVETYILNEEAK